MPSAECAAARGLFRIASATMKTMKTAIAFALAAALGSLPAKAQQQDFPTEPYDFLMAKVAADAGDFDEALSRIDKVIAKDPQNTVLLFERAMMLVDSGRLERADTELRK